MENTKDMLTVSNDPKIAEYRNQLHQLRQKGIFLLNESKEKINDIKKNKLITKEEKEKYIETQKAKIESAKEDIESHKEEIKQLVLEATAYTKEIGLAHEQVINEKVKQEKLIIKQEHAENVKNNNEEYSNRLASIKEKYSQVSSEEEKQNYVME